MSSDEPRPSHAGNLFTDLYELTMLQAYDAQGMDGIAVFELFFRELPEGWNYLLAAGLEQAVHDTLSWRFDEADLAYLRGTGRLSEPLLDRLADWRFTGDIDAVAEGTPVFGHEPLLRVEAPVFDAQLLETLIINRVMFPSLAASKARRIVDAAAGRNVVDFGARRAHGPEAALAVARSSYLAGFSATSLVEAGRRYGIAVTGTMAHSYVLAHEDEAAAFRGFVRSFPDTVLLVDTYNTLSGVDRVIDLAHDLGEDFKVTGVRLDSGDLLALSGEARRRLDEAGLRHVRLLASSGLDEWAIAELVDQGAPIDGFGVGTRLAVSDDAPQVDMAYKLVAYDGVPRMKLSSDKANRPGPKQVYRVSRGGAMVHDILAGRDEPRPVEGEPLLRPVVRGGEMLPDALPELAAIRNHCDASCAALPPRLRALHAADVPYEVSPTHSLNALTDRLTGQPTPR